MAIEATAFENVCPLLRMADEPTQLSKTRYQATEVKKLEKAEYCLVESIVDFIAVESFIHNCFGRDTFLEYTYRYIYGYI